MPNTINERSMGESIFHTNNYPEDYILGKLSEEAEGLFEAHMLTCEHCREQLRITEAIILGTRHEKENERSRHISVKSQSKKWFIRLSMAASVIVLIGLSIMYFVKHNKPTQHKLPTITSADTAKPAEDKKTNIYSPTIEKKITTNNLLAEAYQPLPVYENAIKNYSRSEFIKIESPLMGAEFIQKDSLTFKWKSNDSQLLLVIFNNKGELMIEKEVKSPHVLIEKLANGLYYWQLENEEESLYTGRFSIKGSRD